MDWRVSNGNLICAADNNPLDLYRTILRLETEERSQVFEWTGGSTVVLSPTGMQSAGAGALMAAVDRDLPMMYIESLGYEVDWDAISRIPGESAALIHLWLASEPYPTRRSHRLAKIWAWHKRTKPSIIGTGLFPLILLPIPMQHRSGTVLPVAPVATSSPY